LFGNSGGGRKPVAAIRNDNGFAMFLFCLDRIDGKRDAGLQILDGHCHLLEAKIRKTEEYSERFRVEFQNAIFRVVGTVKETFPVAAPKNFFGMGIVEDFRMTD